MRWNSLRWNIGDTWLGIMRLAAKCTKLVFALAALLSFRSIRKLCGVSTLLDLPGVHRFAPDPSCT